MTIVNLGQEIKTAGNNLAILNPEPVSLPAWKSSFARPRPSDSMWKTPVASTTSISYDIRWELQLRNGLTVISITVPSDRGLVGGVLYLPPLDEIEVKVNGQYRWVANQLVAKDRLPFIRTDAKDDPKGQLDLQRLFDGVEIPISATVKV